MQSPRHRLTSEPRAMTKLDVIAVVGTLVLLIVVFAVMYPVMQEPPVHRSVCQANLKGMGTSLYAYANENNDMWPVCAPFKAIEEDRVRVTYAPNLIGKNRDISDETLAARATGGELSISNTRNLWMLVRLEIAPPKLFNCPHDPDSAVNMDQYPWQNYWDFSKWQEVSYGYQVPFGKLGRPLSNRDERMPLAADRGPFGAALEAGKPNPGVPTAALGAVPNAWSLWNSPNHGREGQNVLYAGGSADWQATPVCGIKNDNTYTRWSDATGGASTAGDNPLIRAHGTLPTGTETPMSDSDTLIYP